MTDVVGFITALPTYAADHPWLAVPAVVVVAAVVVATVIRSRSA